MSERRDSSDTARTAVGPERNAATEPSSVRDEHIVREERLTPTYQTGGPPYRAPVRTWKPVVGGILEIIVGILNIISGIGISLYGNFLNGLYGTSNLQFTGIPAG